MAVHVYLKTGQIITLNHADGVKPTNFLLGSAGAGSNAISCYATTNQAEREEGRFLQSEIIGYAVGDAAVDQRGARPFPPAAG
jgi:hypothetical protein